MPEEQETTQTSAQETTDEQTTLGHAILNAGKGESASEATEEKSEEQAQEVKEPAPEKAEAKTEKEKAETKAPEAEDAEVEKLLKGFKGDAKEAAKAYLHLKKMADGHNKELGDARKEQLEYRNMIKQMRENPDAVIAELQKLKGEKQTSILEQALEDPTKLDQYIEQKIQAGIKGLEDRRDLEQRLEDTYSDFKQIKPSIESMRQSINLGKIHPEEVLYLAVKGYHADKMLEDAKKAVRQEDQEALAKKMEEQIDKQTAVVSEKEEKVPDDQEILGTAILEAKR